MTRRGIAATACAALAVLLLALLFAWWMPASERAFLPFAPDRRCVIAITDDTDFFQFDSTAPVYALVDSLGLRVTKTVWVFDHGEHPPARAGLSLEHPEYREWVLREAALGHEVVLHSASAGHDERGVTIEAHALLDSLLARAPSMIVFHSTNREAFYWGSDRLPNPVLRWLYRLRTGGRDFEGAAEGSPYYWIDVSRRLVRYVRGYTTDDVNTLRLSPSMPYEDPWKPDAPLWCASSNGRLAGEFVSLLSEGNVERLKAEEGVSIVYTHLASGFTEPGRGGRSRVTREVRETFTRCGADPAVEFAPAGEVLDRLRVTQYLEDAIKDRGGRSGRKVVEIPAELVPVLGDVSVTPARLPAPFDVPSDVGSTSVRLDVWLDAVGWEVRASDVSVFDGARQLPPRERWRLVLRWLSTAIVSPAYSYESGA